MAFNAGNLSIAATVEHGGSSIRVLHYDAGSDTKNDVMQTNYGIVERMNDGDVLVAEASNGVLVAWLTRGADQLTQRSLSGTIEP